MNQQELGLNLSTRRTRKMELLELMNRVVPWNDLIAHLKASIRAKVEHPLRVIKRQFGYTKVRYRGLAKF